MTKDEARALKVGVDVVYVAEPTLEEIFKMHVVGVEIEDHSRANSPIRVTGYCKVMSSRVYELYEIFATELEAMQHLADKYQVKSDLALNKRHGVVAKMAALRKEFK